MNSLSVKQSPMSFLDEGQGFPVVFGHSYLWDAEMWRPQLDEMGAAYRCVVPELWGHGDSGAVSGIPYSVGELADDHLALIDALGLGRYALVGLSVGGMWAAEIALNRPRGLAALVLMDTFVGPEPDATRTRYFAMLDAVEQAGCVPPPLIDQILPLFFSPRTLETKPRLVAAFRTRLEAIRGERVASVVALGRAIFSRPSLLERLREIDTPTLIIVGADDRSRPPHEARQMAELIPGAELTVIEQAGHVSNLEQPQEVSQLIREFLGRNIPAS